MAKQNIDILLDANDDLAIENGDFVLGNSLLQETGIILRLNQGELKSDPLLGPSLIRLMRGVGGFAKAVVKAKLHLKRDNKDYNQLKNYINIGGKEY